jgi:hypothetical protein
MKLSPIQLLESNIEVLSIKRDFDGGDAPERSLTSSLDLQVYKNVEQVKDYWSPDEKLEPPELRNRTYEVTLGIRTPPQKNFEQYHFEIVVAGVIVCLPENFQNKSVSDMVNEYGLTLLYGIIREQFAATTSRMRGGTKMLPTLSFIGETDKPTKSQQLKPVVKSAKKK